MAGDEDPGGVGDDGDDLSVAGHHTGDGLVGDACELFGLSESLVEVVEIEVFGRGLLGKGDGIADVVAGAEDDGVVSVLERGLVDGVAGRELAGVVEGEERFSGDADRYRADDRVGADVEDGGRGQGEAD